MYKTIQPISAEELKTLQMEQFIEELLQQLDLCNSTDKFMNFFIWFNAIAWIGFLILGIIRYFI